MLEDLLLPGSSFCVFVLLLDLASSHFSWPFLHRFIYFKFLMCQ
jgi:hypothetical protein